MTEKLSFTATSLQNVIISNESDSIYYEVKTWESDAGLTKVQRLNPKTQLYDLVAEFENTNGRPVAVRIHGQDTVRVEEFLKMENVERSRWGTWDGKVSFVGMDEKEYTWSNKDGVLQLTKEGSEKPVAIFRTYQRWMYLLTVSELPSMDVEQEALDTLDTLIVSFIVTEGTRRGSFF
ncbi:hypothetical protein NEOLEDRAFT_1122878 [Neolentinus lepideus HHB14362 ss-1]|uniref:DUF6593 domain-containing protein n=1 Tax=Neolentinus lepideus HHB14362 ss-1 TaxID=1314782 RepID=A0A165NZ40_9AGAM|nr:hypothetical protein NEOLEDRAFT_1122878 [Neolentinus lepideus HHB14362 ss-1]